MSFFNEYYILIYEYTYIIIIYILLKNQSLFQDIGHLFHYETQWICCRLGMDVSLSLSEQNGAIS